MNCITDRNALLGEIAVKAFTARHFDAFYCATKEEACNKALSIIEENSTVTWGGSKSVAECGLIEKLKCGNYDVIDRSAAKPEEKDDIMRKAFFADTYLMSANALSLTGELVNIDGVGNRVAALCFGPKQVIVIASLNKLMPTLEEAVSRARSVAAPTNAMRFDLCTPCKKTGVCANCTSPDSICSQILITRLCRQKGRIKLILCGETLGF